MGICPGQAPMAMSPFCLLRVRNVPSEEDSASCEVLAGLIQSVIAINSAHYAFSSKPTLRQPLKMQVVERKNQVFSKLHRRSK